MPMVLNHNFASKRRNHLLLLITLLIYTAESGQSEKRLLIDLFSYENYEPLERPAKKDSDAVQVNFGVSLQQIINVDMKNQVINTNIWLTMTWKDYRLVWNPEEANNVSMLNVPVKMVWRPDILLYNSADEKFDATFPSNILTYNDGGMGWIPPGMFLSTCNIDITWFPFDEQKCQLKFGSWTYDGDQLNLTLMQYDSDGDGVLQDEGDTSTFILNGEWTLLAMPGFLNVTNFAGKKYLEAIYYIHIRRRSLYYVFNLILPCFVISSIALLTFVLPPEAGEKISLVVTILLSLTVYLLLVAKAMPPTSDAIPLIGLYFALVNVMCSISVCFTVVVLNFDSRTPETHVMPMWVKKGICDWLAWILRIKRPGKVFSRKTFLSSRAQPLEIKDKTSRSLLANVLDLEDDLRSVSSGLRKSIIAAKACETRSELSIILRELRLITDKMRDGEEGEREVSDWKFAAIVIDTLSLYSILVLTVVSTAGILFSAPNILKSLD